MIIPIIGIWLELIKARRLWTVSTQCVGSPGPLETVLLDPASQIVQVQRLTEDSVKMMSDFMDRVVEWKASDTAPTANQASENVLLHATIDDSNMQITVAGANVKWSFGGNFSNLCTC